VNRVEVPEADLRRLDDARRSAAVIETENLRAQLAEAIEFLVKKDLYDEFHKWQRQRWKNETTV
jgi:hypothetical protein